MKYIPFQLNFMKELKFSENTDGIKHFIINIQTVASLLDAMKYIAFQSQG
jgi:hypothetical protein